MIFLITDQFSEEQHKHTHPTSNHVKKEDPDEILTQGDNKSSLIGFIVVGEAGEEKGRW